MHQQCPNVESHRHQEFTASTLNCRHNNKKVISPETHQVVLLPQMLIRHFTFSELYICPVLILFIQTIFTRSSCLGSSMICFVFAFQPNLTKVQQEALQHLCFEGLVRADVCLAAFKLIQVKGTHRASVRLNGTKHDKCEYTLQS